MTKGCVDYYGRRISLHDLSVEAHLPYSTVKSRWTKGKRGEKLVVEAAAEAGKG